jgi:hypothetical protein
MNFVKELLGTSDSKPPTGETESTPPKPQLVEQKGGKTRKVSKYGSRRMVFNGSAEMTNGGLRKENLIKNERGRIVSAKKHSTMKQRHSTSS